MQVKFLIQNKAFLLPTGIIIVGRNSDENSFSLPPQKNFYNNPPKKTPPENPLSRIFDGIENDKLIILALLWVLWNEKADPKLLLALLYLLI